MDIEHTYYNGKRYQRYPNSKNDSDRKYFKRGSRWLHRVIWETEVGPIPEGYHIHHKDRDTGNNALENLECIDPRAHLEEHSDEIRARVTTEQHLQHLANIRDLAKAWHSTDDGLKLHSANGKKVWSQVKERTFTCHCCGAEFQATNIQGSKYCSNKCKSQARRDSGVDNIGRTCSSCGKTFVINRYYRAQKCSRSCKTP